MKKRINATFNELIEYYREKNSTILIVIGVIFYLTFIANENLFKEFTPRRMCMFNDTKLILVHFFSNLIIAIDYVGIGIIMYRIYHGFKTFHLPWKGFLWMFAGFIFLCGLTHVMGVLNLFVTFYWIDGLINMFTSLFSTGVFLTLLRDQKNIKQLKSPEEYQEMANRIVELQKLYDEVKLKNDANSNNRGSL